MLTSECQQRPSEGNTIQVGIKAPKNRVLNGLKKVLLLLPVENTLEIMKLILYIR